MNSYKKILVDCVIVTFNRIELLKKCVAAVSNQEGIEVNNIFIIDNHSTDGTEDYLQWIQKRDGRVVPVRLKHNVGGAGGFNVGLKKFIATGKSDYVWIMDDDTVPRPTALRELVRPLTLDLHKTIGYLASNVRWKDDTVAVMNVPRAASDWNDLVGLGLVKVESASFVSLLVSRKIVEKVGFPISDFFIWGDDVEYTTRISQITPNNYFVTKSIVDHLMKTNIGVDIVKEKDKSRANRFFYSCRNILYVNKKYHGVKGAVRTFLGYTYLVLRVLASGTDYKWYKIGIILKGMFWGVFFNPKIEKAKN